MAQEDKGFGPRQWALAVSVSLAVHGLLVWAWLAITPPVSSLSGGHGGLSLGTLSWGETETAPLRAQAAAAPLSPQQPPPAETALTAEPLPTPVPLQPKRPSQSTQAVTPQPTAQPAPQHDSSPGRTASARTPSAPLAQPRSAAGGHSGQASGRDGTTGVDREAKPLPGNPPPAYPLMARRQGIEGRVLIRVAVLRSGQVAQVDVADSSGSALLDKAALRAIKRWRFQPALHNGRAIAATITVPVIFQLTGGQT